MLTTRAHHRYYTLFLGAWSSRAGESQTIVSGSASDPTLRRARWKAGRFKKHARI
jgi:hypothetical protein